MSNKITAFIFSVALTFSAGTYASDDATNTFTKDFQFIQENYASGYCLKLFDDPLRSEPARRYFTLVALQDITFYAAEIGKNATHEIIGSLNSYKIGRKLNRGFVNFIEYAERPDVQKIVAADADEFSKATKQERDLLKNELEAQTNKIKAIALSAKSPVATRTKEEAIQEINKITLHPFLCILHEIIMIPDSDAALEFQEYADSVNRRALRTNMENFRQMMEDY